MSDVAQIEGILEKFKGRVVKEFRPPVNHLITIDKENIISFKSKREMYERAEALRDLRIKKAREDPNAFMEYCFCDTWTGEPQRQQWFHDDWQTAMNEGKRVLIIAPRNHGKCVIGTDYITLHDGSRAMAKDLPKYSKIRTWSEETGWVNADAHKFADQVQPCVKIKTKNGRFLTVSNEHPMWTPNGWVEASNIKPGDRLGVGRGIGCGTVSYSKEKAFILGVLLGDGCLSSSSTVGMSLGEPELAEKIKDFCGKIGWGFNVPKKEYQYTITRLNDNSHLEWTRSLGIQGKKAADKKIPECVFTWDEESLCAFLSGYLETDCHVGNKKAGRVVEFYSISEDLLRSYQSLLLRINVNSILQDDYKNIDGERYRFFRLRVNSSSINILADKLNMGGPNEQKLKAMSNQGSNDCIDTIPDALVDRLLPGRFKRIKPRFDTRRPKGHQRSKVIERAQIDNIPALETNANLAWDEVAEVIQLEPQQTYSIEVKNVHTHMVNDFVTHNTSQIVGRVIWEIGTNPNLRVKIACASDGAAKDRLFEVKQHIEYNKRIHEVFPELVPSPGAEWSKHKIIVKRTARHKDATVEALGITATATGGRCDLLIADDVVDRRNALSFPALREQIKQAWKSDWTNLLEPTSRVWYICTLWHKDDLSHELMDNPAYRVLFYQISETFESMWPEKWPSEILELRHREIGSVEFNRGFRNVAVDLDSATVHPDWIKFRNLNKDPLFNLRLKNGELIFITSYDTAGTPSGGKQQDYASSVVLAASPMDQKVYVVSAAHYRATVKKQAERVVREQKKYNAYKAIVEKASQAAVDEWVLELEPAMMGIMEVQKPTGENKRSRLMGVTPLMERGQVIFSHNLNPHDRDNNYNPGTGCIYDELIDFPYAKHDDMVDAFSQGLHAVRRLFLDRGSNLDATIDMSIDDMHDSEYLI